MADIDAIARYRCAAVPQLVRKLRIMPPGHYFPTHQNLEAEHYLWTNGALRAITGRDFYGSVTRRQMARFVEAARFFLREYAPAGKVKPVAIWPSHGALYIAPVSAQRQIIREWQTFAKSGACQWSEGRHHLQPNWFLTGDMDH